MICDEAVEGVNFVNNTSLSGLRPTRNYLTQLYHKVVDEIEKTKSSAITFCKSLKYDILLYTFANAYEVFDKMVERYIQKRNIEYELETTIRPELNGTMGPAVIRELLKNTMYKSKGAFRASVLIQLAKEEGKFESYIPYFENPVKFLKNTLMQSIEDYSLKQEPSFILANINFKYMNV